MMELFGGSAELAALADEDSNELLRFVEASMTEDESSAFIARLESRDPLAAMRLLRMQEDHRLLRTTGEVVPGRDLLGPVRARFARGELVADSNFAAGSAEPTDFMERSVASLARRRRRTGRRFAQVAIAFLVITGGLLLVGWRQGWFGPRSTGGVATVAAVDGEDTMELAQFALMIPVADKERAETEIALKAIEQEAIFMRNRPTSRLGPDGGQPRPIVGIIRDGPSDRLRASLADRGFQYVVVVDRDTVSGLLADLGRIAPEAPSSEGARLVSSAEPPTRGEGRDAWATWTGRSDARSAVETGEGRLVVPIALVPVKDEVDPEP